MPVAKIKIDGKMVPISAFTSEDKKELLSEANQYAKDLNDNMKQEIDELNGAVTDLDKYLDEAFKDGIISEAEAKAIRLLVKNLESKKAEMDREFTDILNNQYIDMENKSSLISSKNWFDTKHEELINTIMDAISDGLATESEMVLIDAAFLAYNNGLSLMVSALRSAIDQISDAKAKESYDKSIDYTNGSIAPIHTEILNAKSAIEQNATQIGFRVTQLSLDTQLVNIKQQALDEANEYAEGLKQESDKAIGDLEKDLTDTSFYIENAFKDGIITAMEASGIRNYLNTLQASKDAFDSEFQDLYTNSYLKGSFSTNLWSAKSSLDYSHNQLVEAIMQAIEDDVATAEEINNVNTKFSLYGQAVSNYKIAVGQAIDSIAREKAEEAQQGAMDYTDGQLVPVKRTLTEHEASIVLNADQIRSKVSEQTFNAGLDQTLDQSKKYTKELSDALEFDLNIVRGDVSEVSTYIEGAFRDGIIYEAEYRQIEAYLNSLAESKATFDARYNEIYIHPQLAGTPKTDLSTAKINYNNKYNALVTTINEVIQDQLADPDEIARVDQAFVAYNGAINLLATALERAISAIAQAKADSAAELAKGYADNIRGDLDKDIKALQSDIKAVDNYVDGAFRDGIVTESEAKRISSYLNILDETKATLSSKYTEIYNNTDLDGTYKADLNLKMTAYNNSYTDLTNYIRTVMADGIATPDEIGNVNIKFINYNTTAGDVNKSMDRAIARIAQNKADRAQRQAEGYADGKVAPIDNRLRIAESDIKQNAESIQLRVTETVFDELQKDFDSLGIIDLKLWARHYMDSPMLVKDATDPAYKSTNFNGMAYTNMSQVLGGMFGAAITSSGKIQGGIDTPSTAWALINMVKLFKKYNDVKYKTLAQTIGDFFIRRVINIDFYGSPFKAMPNSFSYNETTKNWQASTNFIHIRTFYHSIWALMELYDIDRQAKWKDLAGQLLDGVAIFHENIKQRVNAGELATYMRGAQYNAINVESGTSYAPSWTIFANTTLDVVWEGITKYITLMGDQNRTNGEGVAYSVRALRDEYSAHLKLMYDTKGLRRSGGHALLYCFTHYDWADATDSQGRYNPTPKNWDFLVDNWSTAQWFTGDLEFWAIRGFALAGHTAIAKTIADRYFTLRVPDRGEEILFYDRYDKDGKHLPNDETISIAFTALFMGVQEALGDKQYHKRCVTTLRKYQKTSNSKVLDGGFTWDITEKDSVLESKSLGEIIHTPIENSSIDFSLGIILDMGKKVTDDLDYRVSYAESTITQHSTAIELRVETKDYNGNAIASLINQTATTISISAEKINLQGAVRITDFNNEARTMVNNGNAAKTTLDAKGSVWDAKETPTGAQAKATLAENNAKTYVDRNTGNLVNNPTATRTSGKWSGSGLSVVDTNFLGETVPVLQSSTSSNVQYYSDYFKVDPSKAYEVSAWFKKSANDGLIYFGVNAKDSADNTIGIAQISDASGGLANADNTNFYFWTSKGGNAPTDWTKVTFYIMPSGTNGKNLKGIGQYDSNFASGWNHAVMKPNTDSIRLRWLNWNNSAVRQVWVANIKAVEVDPTTLQNMSINQEIINSNKSVWDRAGNFRTDGKLDVTSLYGQLTDAQLASANKWNRQGTYIDATGVYTGIVVADQIKSGTISSVNLDAVNITGSTIMSQNRTNYTTIQGGYFESSGLYSRTWRGVTKVNAVDMRFENGYLRARNNTENWSLYFSDYGISTYADGVGNNDASGTIAFRDTYYSAANSQGITVHSSYGVVALRSDNNRVVIDANNSIAIESQNSAVYVKPMIDSRPGINEFRFAIKNVDSSSLTDGWISFGSPNTNYAAGIRFQKTTVGEPSVFITNGNGDVGTGLLDANILVARSYLEGSVRTPTSYGYFMVDDALRITSKAGYNGGNISWRDLQCANVQSNTIRVHTGTYLYLGCSNAEVRVTNNLFYNGGDTGYRPIRASDFLKSSSRRYKRNIKEFTGSGLEQIMPLKVSTFQMKSDFDAGIENPEVKVGVIAEDSPSIVTPDGLGVNQDKLLYYTVKSVQEIQHEFDEYKQFTNMKLDLLLKRIQKLEGVSST